MPRNGSATSDKKTAYVHVLSAERTLKCQSVIFRGKLLGTQDGFIGEAAAVALPIDRHEKIASLETSLKFIGVRKYIVTVTI